MDKNFKALQLRQTDELLKPLREKQMAPRPGGGWIQAIRESLGMTAVALARRLKMRSSSVHKFEQAEIDESISLASLRKVAAALGCGLHYALVPMKSLEEMLHDRAYELARNRLSPVAHTMALEDQALSSAANQLLVDLLAKELLEGSRRELW